MALSFTGVQSISGDMMLLEARDGLRRVVVRTRQSVADQFGLPAVQKAASSKFTLNQIEADGSVGVTEQDCKRYSHNIN